MIFTVEYKTLCALFLHFLIFRGDFPSSIHLKNSPLMMYCIQMQKNMEAVQK